VTEPSKSLTYTSYLALDEILGAQRPRSDEHDEMLFIVVHQVYELWFKELLHELEHLQRLLEEGRGSQALSTFKRILTILKLVVAQLDVIETLQPTQFVSFRDRLESASGFQSAQFRELEAVLGRRERAVLRAYEEGSDSYREIEAALQRRSLYDSFLAYLSLRGYAVPADRLEREGLVTRSRDLEDRRQISVELTAAGKSLHRRLRSVAQRLDDRVCAGLTNKDRSDLQRVLERIRANVGGEAWTPALTSGSQR